MIFLLYFFFIINALNLFSFFSYLTIFQPFIEIMNVGDKKKIVRKICCKDELYKYTKNEISYGSQSMILKKFAAKLNEPIFYVLDEETFTKI